MKLYNTLTRQIDTLQPLHDGKVSIYTCGPTVYDYAHIGHWFNYVRMDTLIRALKLDGLDTNWVMNITDVGHLVSDADDGEDKLEKGAKREGKTAWEIAEFYTQDFMECWQILGMLQPDHITKATDHIAEQLELIKQLEIKGYTYVIDDGVYYDTSNFENYAEFARLDLDNQEAGARVTHNEQKRNHSDFALWKFSPEDIERDMEWNSPWGGGFPGWHIECSAMAMKYLGDQLDIHTGGIDHIPVHHTNEIAQSEAVTGKRFAQIWLHSNHVTVNGEKISKSLGNGIRLQDIIEKGIPAAAVRLHILESHYRTQAKFSWESLEAAHNRLKNWQSAAALIWQIQESGDTEAVTKAINDALESVKADIVNDLNTPQVLSAIDKAFSVIETHPVTAESEPIIATLLQFVKETLGIDLLEAGPIGKDAFDVFKERLLARNNQDWAKSDELRDQLAALGYGVRDGASAITWYRL